ncbi:MAG: cell division protein FtsA [Candidatus Omnitrophota bacterium]
MTKYNFPVTGLDIGSAKTTICVGNYDHLNQVEIYAAAMVKTHGMDRGIVTNPGEVARCIEEVVKKVEQKLKVKFSSGPKSYQGKKILKINEVYTTVNGEHILGNNSKGMLNLSNRPVEITRKDTQMAIDSVKFLTTTIDREILHALAQEYIIDGYKRIKDPIGSYGSRLGVNLHILSAQTSFMKSVIKVINRAGLDVEDCVFSGLATSMSTLTESDKQLGIILVEVGAGSINILFFKDGRLQHTSVISFGGNDITEKIMEKFSIDFAQAEQLKMQYKSSNNHCLIKDDQLDKIIIKKSATVYESITHKQLTSVIDQQIEKMLELLKKDLELGGIIARANCGIVICGGISFMDGIIEKVENYLGIPVNLGILRGFVSSFSGLSNMFYATGIGLVKYALEQNSQPLAHNSLGNGFMNRLVSRAKSVYDEYF